MNECINGNIKLISILVIGITTCCHNCELFLIVYAGTSQCDVLENIWGIHLNELRRKCKTRHFAFMLESDSFNYSQYYTEIGEWANEVLHFVLSSALAALIYTRSCGACNFSKLRDFYVLNGWKVDVVCSSIWVWLQNG